MSTVGLSAFNTAFTGFFKPLGSATISFNFWHLFAPKIVKNIPEIKTQQGKMHGPAEFMYIKQQRFRLPNPDSRGHNQTGYPLFS
jgi:hypothetical protein